MPFVGKIIEVGSEAVNLTEDTGTSGVQITHLINLGDRPVYLAGGYEIGPGEDAGMMEIGSTEQLSLALADDDDNDEPVRVKVLLRSAT